MIRAPAILAVLLLATGCQKPDAALQSRLAAVEQANKTLAETVSKNAEEIDQLQTQAALRSLAETCVPTTSPGLAWVGHYAVGQLELVDHAQGVKLRGILVNPTALTVHGLRYTVSPLRPDGEDSPFASDLTILDHVRPGGSVGFSVLLPGAKAADAKVVCVAYPFGMPARRP